jgi:hypothetical protein
VLPASEAAVYVEVDAAGAVSSNTVGWTLGKKPLFLCATGAIAITSIADRRVGFDFSGASGGHIVQDEGVDLDGRTNLNFTGDSVAATDDAGNDRTQIAINHLATAVHSVAQPVTVQEGGAAIGTRAKLNFIAGTNAALEVADNAGTGAVDVTVSATGSATWRHGIGAPSNTLGIDGDFYLDSGSGDVFYKSSGSYAEIANLIGPAGSGGAAGTVWRDGAGTPNDAVGANGDYYLDDDTGDVYARSAGAYGLVANIKGGGVFVKDVAGSADVTLSASEAKSTCIELIGTLTGDIMVFLPANRQLWSIANNTTGAFTITIKTSAGTVATVLTDTRLFLGDGVDVFTSDLRKVDTL